jgi:hypothetical protein
MARLTSEQARELAEQFYKLSKKLGTYRFAHWNSLTKGQRTSIESLEWSLLNASSDLTAMTINLAMDEIEPVVKRITRTTRRMTAAVKRLKRVEQVIRIAEAAVGLSGAIVSGSPAAIVSALDTAVEASS